ncbi:hypothetical protein LTR56_027093 [Elasticomyces elasticus]|nr:hypothetical protein LTR56_027093 [Elasticomyces elasticus]KAK3616391.1 hypothetical protein LTR22_027089 [Elasticomyces elasticus]
MHLWVNDLALLLLALANFTTFGTALPTRRQDYRCAVESAIDVIKGGSGWICPTKRQSDYK